MKAFKRSFTSMVAGILSFPYLLMAQDDGTYIDDLGVQDSSYMEQDLLTEGAQGPGSDTSVIIIVVAVIIIAVVGYLIIKKRKK